jgi:hypothetical protein
LNRRGRARRLGDGTAWKEQVAALGGKFPLIPGDPVCYQHGDDWKVVHIHASIGIPNQDALGEELPT